MSFWNTHQKSHTHTHSVQSHTGHTRRSCLSQTRWHVLCSLSALLLVLAGHWMLIGNRKLFFPTEVLKSCHRESLSPTIHSLKLPKNKLDQRKENKHREYVTSKFTRSIRGNLLMLKTWHLSGRFISDVLRLYFYATALPDCSELFLSVIKCFIFIKPL